LLVALSFQNLFFALVFLVCVTRQNQFILTVIAITLKVIINWHQKFEAISNYCGFSIVDCMLLDTKSMKVNYPKLIILQEQTDSDSEQKEALCCSCFKCNKPTENQEVDCVCCSKHITCLDINIYCCNEYFPNTHMLKGMVRVLLLLVKYTSQLVTVPLLFLQIFDTHSLLCFSPDPYCSSTTEHKLHLTQAVIMMLFYCSLTLSQLASTMLIWNPWPKADETIKKTSQLNNLLPRHQFHYVIV